MRLKGKGPGPAIAVAAAAVALLAVAFAACNGGSSAPTATVPAGLSPLPGTPTPTPVPPLEPTTWRFLYSAFAFEADTIWSVDPEKPDERVKIVTIPHKAGWAITPVVSPGGGLIAYNVMPELGVYPAYDAEAYVLDIKSGESKLIAEHVDLLTRPVWSPGDHLVFLRRNTSSEVTVILVELGLPMDEEGEANDTNGEEPMDDNEMPPVRTVLKQHESTVLAYAPLGIDDEEALIYFVQVQGGTLSGSYLGRYGPATGEAVATATAIPAATETAVATASIDTPTLIPTETPPPSPTPLTGDVFLVLSDQIVRDYALSPKADKVTFVVPGLVDGRFVTQTYVADIEGKAVEPLPSPEGLDGDQVSPVWHPRGDRIAVGQLPSGGEPGRVAIVPLSGGKATFLLPPVQGFDQPLSWSPDGEYLAAKVYPGQSLAEPGVPTLVFLTPGGQRIPLAGSTEIAPLGWVKG